MVTRLARIEELLGRSDDEVLGIPARSAEQGKVA